ncbi:hypothetical protein MMC24_004011 [Lignoscripta atroalba]|nr:hypothetical protein [Lignoscripta atroalba]
MQLNFLILSSLGSLVSSAAILSRTTFNIPALSLSLKTLPALPKGVQCNLASTIMPASSPPLPPPSPGLYLYHVALGRGTQNYTCASPSATPAAFGAVATLYNASCVTASIPPGSRNAPDLSSAALKIATSRLSTSTLANLVLSGYHYFSSGTTPVFNLNSPNGQLGVTSAKKVTSSPAPSTADRGQYGTVPWLKLDLDSTRAGSMGPVKEIYRINTAGGSPPATCAGQPASFQIDYAAEYWFYASTGA